MKILIIEDEKPAANRLQNMIKKYDASINITEVLQSVKESVKWLKNNNSPELILLDIQLTDGLSLNIFKEVNINSPVIFTTAYDEYIIKAFNYNGIDYLLKPIKEEKLFSALDKYKKLKEHFTSDISSLIKSFSENEKSKKERITVKDGINFISIKTNDIAFFYTEHKLVFLVNKDGKKYLVDKNLTELENELNDNEFFRLNRKYLANINSIIKFKPIYKSKIKIELNPAVKEEVIVSQEKASQFKNWIER